MRTKALSVQIPNPCTQNWEAMKIEDGSRLCTTCQKSVIDFSTYSTAEIIKTLTAASSNLCGRLTQKQLAQLNYQVIAVPSPNSWIKYLGVLAIGTGIFMQSCEKRVDIKGEPIILDQNAGKEKPALVTKIHGYVIDDFNEPVIGSRVVIANTGLFAITDEKGKYEINVGSSFDPDQNLLVVEGDLTKNKIRINYYKAQQDTVKVQFPEMMMMGMIMIPPPIKK